MTRTTKITDEILESQGFKKVEGKRLIGDTWRLQMPFHPHIFEFTKGDFPATNANCGILSIYEPAHKVVGFDKNGKRKVYKYNESTRAIAWYVNTLERLRTIITVLTEKNT